VRAWDSWGVHLHVHARRQLVSCGCVVSTAFRCCCGAVTMYCTVEDITAMCMPDGSWWVALHWFHSVLMACWGQLPCTVLLKSSPQCARQMAGGEFCSHALCCFSSPTVRVRVSRSAVRCMCEAARMDMVKSSRQLLLSTIAPFQLCRLGPSFGAPAVTMYMTCAAAAFNGAAAGAPLLAAAQGTR
jgi:hypothetical protein